MGLVSETFPGQAPAPRWERRVAAVVAAWAVATVLWLSVGVTVPDGVGYFEYLPSSVIDHDLLFFNQWATMGLVRGKRILFKEVTKTDHLADHWTVGSALFWLPSFLVGDAAWHSLPSLHSFPRDGFRLPHVTASVTASAIAALLALLLGLHLARGAGASPDAALLAVLGTFIGTPLMFYALRGSLMGHVVTSLACTVVVVLSLRLRRGFDAESLLAVGLAVGFACACRPQVAPFVIVPVLIVGGRAFLAAGRKLFWYPAGLVLGGLPQLVVSTFVYGSPLGFITTGVSGAGKAWAAFERVWTWQPFFSWYHGMFTWTPFLLLGVIGLAMLWRSDPGLGRAALLCLASQAMLNAVMDRPFWAGHALGQRRFDSMVPFFLVGATLVLDRMPRWLAVAVTSLTCAWTFGLFIAADSPHLDLNAYVPPGELVSAWAGALADPSTWLRPLAFVPAAGRVRVFAVMVLTLLAWAIGAVMVWRARPKVRTELAAAYLAACSVVLVWCGFHDRARIEPWRDLITANRRLGEAAGGAQVRSAFLHQEAAWLRQTGRYGEAARVRGEAEAFDRALAARLREAGLSPDGTQVAR